MTTKKEKKEYFQNKFPELFSELNKLEMLLDTIFEKLDDIQDRIYEIKDKKDEIDNLKENLD